MKNLRIVKKVTNRDTESLTKYFQDISKIPLLTPQEEAECAHKIKQGDMNAMKRLIEANLRFVVSVAKQYVDKGLSLQDLINEGNLGLIRAAHRFDETRGFKFISYAVWWIRQSILVALSEQARVVRIPLNRIEELNRVNRMRDKLEKVFEREPSVHEIADALDLLPDDVKEIMTSKNNVLSMDVPFSIDEDNSLYDVLHDKGSASPDKNLLKESLSIEIEKALSNLSEREAMIIRLFYGVGGQKSLSLDEISAKLNITKERIRQIKYQAIKKIKTSHENDLKSYLG